MRVTGLGGGIGASRLWRVLAPEMDSASTLVVNTAEDLWHLGLRVCPDLDTTLYALSGRQDLQRGWGLSGETFRVMDEVRDLGEEVWFNLGDRDLATHLLRTSWLRDGLGLAEVTRRLSAAMGVSVRVVPMTEHEVTTLIQTQDGRTLHYEEFLVREACAPPISGVRAAGVEAALPAPGVIDAIEEADVVVLAPSNPVASIEPILALTGVRDALRRRRESVIAVSPIVSGVPITDPGEARRAKSREVFLRARGVRPDASGVAELYKDLCTRFVVDEADAEESSAIARLGLEPVIAPLLIHTGADPVSLVTAIGDACRSAAGTDSR